MEERGQTPRTESVPVLPPPPAPGATVLKILSKRLDVWSHATVVYLYNHSTVRIKGRERTGTVPADAPSPRSSAVGLLFKRNLGGIGHGLANWPTRGQPLGQSHLLQSLEFRDLWAGLARLAKDFATRSRPPGRIRGSITRELAGDAEASPTWCSRESAGLLKISILAEVPALVTVHSEERGIRCAMESRRKNSEWTFRTR